MPKPDMPPIAGDIEIRLKLVSGDGQVFTVLMQANGVPDIYKKVGEMLRGHLAMQTGEAPRKPRKDN